MPTLLTRPIGFMKLPRKAKPFVVFVVLLLCLLTCHLLGIRPSAHIDQHLEQLAPVEIKITEQPNDLLAVPLSDPNLQQSPGIKQRTSTGLMKPQNKSSPIRIAYLFAGSVRSYICPKVHWSIRMNAIDAFGGEAYTFVRVTLEDNKNIQRGDGKVIPSQFGSQEEVEEALKILQPRQVTYFNLSTQLEEMQRLFPSVPHRIFQANDLRRYSMYYHRCMAYRMAMEYEQTHDIRFDWIVMIRLDTAWLEPVLPIQYYANDRVWLTETGYVALNDQFMLVPRQFSDYVFDLDTKVQKGVYCLGGPDVEKWKCNRTELETRQVPSDMVGATLDRCCPDLLYSDVEGFSERIQMRHLRSGSIPISLARFLVYITRLRKNGVCYAECSRLHYHFKFHSMESLDREYPYFAPLHPLDKTHISVLGTDSTKCAYLHHNAFRWKPISAWEVRQQVEQGLLPALNYSVNLFAQYDRLHASIPVNPTHLHLWTIHPSRNVDGCLSVNFTNLSFYWRDCDYHDRLSGGRRYAGDQVFFLFVDPPHRSMLRDPYLQREDSVFHFEDIPYPNQTRIVMYERHVKTMDMMREVYCIAIKKKGKRSEVRLQKCSQRGLDPNEWFFTVQGGGLGSHPQSTVGLLRSWKYPDQCIMHSDDVRQHWKKPSALLLGDGQLSVGPCPAQIADAPGRMYFEFQLVSN